MTKGNLVATSFVGALPAAGLAYLTIMAFISYADKMATMLQVVTGTALVCSVLMALSPFAILLFVKSAAAAAEATAPAAGPAPKSEPSEEVAAAEEEDELNAEALDDEAPSSGTDDEDLSLSGFDESVDETSAASDSDMEFDDEGFEFDDDEK